MAAPIGHSLSEETEAVQGEVLDETRANLHRRTTSEGLGIPVERVLVVAQT